MEDPAALVGASGLSQETWFVIDAQGSVVPSQISIEQYSAAHSCASAIGFYLTPDAPLAAGAYRLVLLTERVRWPVLRAGHDITRYAGVPAIVEYYRVDDETPSASRTR